VAYWTESELGLKENDLSQVVNGDYEVIEESG
jgi:hypothetical protein